MADVKVVTDSSCDLPASIADELGIEIVPLKIRFGDDEFVDRADMTPNEFWDRCARSSVLPETAAPPPGAFEAACRDAATGGASGVLCITISSRVSATGQAAEVAAKSLEGEVPVKLVDSLSASMGLGLIVLAAARLAAEGLGVDEVAAAATDLVPRTRVYGALDTLEN